MILAIGRFLSKKIVLRKRTNQKKARVKRSQNKRKNKSSLIQDRSSLKLCRAENSALVTKMAH